MQRDADRNIAIVRELIQEMDAGNLAVLDSLCAQEFVAHFNGMDLTLAEVRDAATGFISSFSDLKHTVCSIDAYGDRVRLHALDTATHRESGKIAEVWQEMDVDELMRRILAGQNPLPKGEGDSRSESGEG